MTQDQFAEALGTATRNVRRIEAGQNLTLYTLARIGAVLAVPPRDLLPEDSGSDRFGRYGAAVAQTHAVAERPEGVPGKLTKKGKGRAAGPTEAGPRSRKKPTLKRS